MRLGVCQLRGMARYTAPTPLFSSAWQIVRGVDSAFKTPPTSPPRHPFGGASSKGLFSPILFGLALHRQRCNNSGSLAMLAAIRLASSVGKWRWVFGIVTLVAQFVCTLWK